MWSYGQFGRVKSGLFMDFVYIFIIHNCWTLINSLSTVGLSCCGSPALIGCVWHATASYPQTKALPLEKSIDRLIYSSWIYPNVTNIARVDFPYYKILMAPWRASLPQIATAQMTRSSMSWQMKFPNVPCAKHGTHYLLLPNQFILKTMTAPHLSSPHGVQAIDLLWSYHRILWYYFITLVE